MDLNSKVKVFFKPGRGGMESENWTGEYKNNAGFHRIENLYMNYPDFFNPQRNLRGTLFYYERNRNKN